MTKEETITRVQRNWPPARAQQSGFTGNFCQICGGVKMLRTGTCETCMDCGTQGGCA